MLILVIFFLCLEPFVYLGSLSSSHLMWSCVSSLLKAICNNSLGSIPGQGQRPVKHWLRDIQLNHSDSSADSFGYSFICVKVLQLQNFIYCVSVIPEAMVVQASPDQKQCRTKHGPEQKPCRSQHGPDQK